jgi:membrane associated rhomboid family serine protease
MPTKSALKKEVTALVHETRDRALLVSRGALLLWMVEALDLFAFRGGLDNLGIRPRETTGLVGIFFAPFLHGGFGHLLANTVPFLILGFLVTARKRMDFWVVAVGSALSAGVGTWLTGAPGSLHIGASGVVFGFLGFLMGRGIYERRAGAILLSLTVTFFFGGMLWGVLPTVGPGISWQGHLFGWLGGLLVSRLLGRELQKKGGRRR